MLAVDEDLVVFHLQVVALIDVDAALIDRQVGEGQLDALSLLRNPYRTIVVARPLCVAVERIDHAREDVAVCDGTHGSDEPLLLEGLCGTLRERHVAVILFQYGVVEDGAALHVRAVEIAEALYVLLADVEFLAQVVIALSQKFACCHAAPLNEVGVLHVLRLLVGLAVEIDDLVLDLQHLSRHSDAALHIVFAAVSGARVNHAIDGLVLHEIVAPQGVGLAEEVALLQEAHRGEVDVRLLLHEEAFARVIDHLVVVLSLIGLVAQQGVASRIVEDDDVVEFYVSQTLHTAVVPVRPLDVALAVEDRHGMLGKRHGERCLRDARSVAHLGDGEVVAREEALL